MSDFKKLGVIGHPIKQSLSPEIHNYWIAKYGIAGQYDAIDIHPDQLEDHIKFLIEEQDYRGFNVTIPHKEAVLDLCSSIDDAVPNIGSVNTLVVQENGGILGKNTDAFGFIENIKSHEPSFDFAAGPALVLGAGGAARAVIYALKNEGILDIYICNRTVEKAEGLAEFFDVNVAPWEARSSELSNVNLLVNTTSLGMTGQPSLDIDLSALPSSALVNDIVYKPLVTDLLRQAQSQGLKAVTGIGMLLHQARPAFEAWFGVLPDVAEDLENRISEKAA